jgi:ethanolamine utilization protein EutN
VIGHVTATIKHPSFDGWRMLIVQPLGAQRGPDGDPVIAVDKLGAGAGSVVILDSEGQAARDYIGDQKSPVRWFVAGIVDESRRERTKT